MSGAGWRGGHPAEAGQTVALAGVSVVAAAGCARLFGDAGWVVPVFAAVAGAHAVGALSARWSVRAASAAHGAALALMLVMSVGGRTAYGIPTPASLSALGRAVGRAPDAVRSAIAPAPTTPELIFLAVAGLWVIAAAADGLARRRKAGLVAVLPPAVFVIVAAALGTPRLQSVLTFGFGAATALYAALDRAATQPANQATRLRAEPVRRPAASGVRFRRAVAGLGDRRAVRLAGPAVALGLAAVILGPAVPGVGRAVIDVHALGVTLDVSRIELNPMVDIRPQLLATRRTELFTVRTTAPAYWRLTALDRFDGRRWAPSRPALHRRSSRLPDEAPDRERALEQEFRLSTLDSPWLPAADRAIRVKAAEARLDPETDSLVTRKGSQEVRSYRVESRLPRERARPAAATTGRPGSRPNLTRYLALPQGFPARVQALAAQVTAGASTPYTRAAALEQHLRADFAYDEQAPAGGSISAIEQFLFHSRRGFCEQFAGAFAAMARSIGLPARVAVGFTPGDYDAGNDVFRVTTREAHAWPEVFVDGVGWTAFEPTPGRSLPDPEAEVRPDTGSLRLASAGPVGRASAGQSTLARVDPGEGPGLDAGPGSRPGGLSGAVSGHRTLWWLILAALGLVGVAPAAKARRRALRRRARAGEAVLAAWAEALDRLAEAGMARRGAETPLEFARRAAAAHPGVAASVRRLAVLVNGAAYGPEAGGDGAAAWQASDQVAQALDAHDSGWVRCRRRLDPRTLGRP